MINRKGILIATLLAGFVIIIAGCGGSGGGGGGGGTQPSGVVITGRVMDYHDSSKGVAGATVTIASYSATTASDGRFRVVMAENVVEPTFSVSVPTGYLNWWAYYGGSAVHPSAIPTPLPLYNGKDLGTIYLWSTSNGGPIPPPIW